MAGDRYNLAVKSHFKPQPVGGKKIASLVAGDIFNSLLNAMSGGVSAISQGKATATDLSAGGSPLTLAIRDFLSTQNIDNQSNTTTPYAYLNWILLDEQFNYVPEGSGFKRVNTGNVLETHAFLDVAIPKSGYLYVFVSNETLNFNVFFDNLSVVHYTGPMLEETHYYPFGLVMAGISSKAVGKVENHTKFVTQLLDEDLGWGTYQFRFRTHDPQTGRFIQIDPLASKYVYNSTYAYAENKVINGIDLEGKEFLSALIDCASGNYGGASTNLILWWNNKKETYREAMSATARIGNGTSERASTPGPIAIQNVQASLNGINDRISQGKPFLDIYNIVNTLAAALPGGEAGAAVEATSGVIAVAGGNFEVIALETALNAEGKAILGEASQAGWLKESFDGGYFLVAEAKQDMNVVRVFGGTTNQKGSFFGMTTPASSAEAEGMYFLKEYGNNASQLTTATIKKGTQFAVGKVSNGTGIQIYIPSEIQKGKVIYSGIVKALH
jgi:RHS repeat-associated protein